MIDRLRSELESLHVSPQDLIVVGYSGGPDSACLLDLLVRLGQPVIAAHLHHGQRPEADADEEATRAWCAGRGIPFAAGRADVPQLAKDEKIGLEEAGRRARYRFLDEVVNRTGARYIATAHTSTDVAETVLFRLARGTGMKGMSGIPPVRGNVIRPLLWASREETTRYCREHRIQTLSDTTNEDTRFARARIRKHVVPELQAINPAAEDAIVRAARLLGEEDRYLDSVAAAILETCEVQLNGPLRSLTADVEAACDIAKLLAYPLVPVRRALRLLAEALGGTLEFEAVETILERLAKEPQGSWTLGGGDVVFEWSSGLLHAQRLEDVSDFRLTLSEPETVGGGGWSFSVEKAASDEEHDPLVVRIDASLAKGGFYVRNRKPGDRIQPLGVEGSKKVSDILAERRLTLAARNRLPILFDIVGPVWIPGVCVSERARISGSRVLRIEFRPAGPGRS